MEQGLNFRTFKQCQGGAQLALCGNTAVKVPEEADAIDTVGMLVRVYKSTSLSGHVCVAYRLSFAASAQK